jgi:hypothetical protein
MELFRKGCDYERSVTGNVTVRSYLQNSVSGDMGNLSDYGNGLRSNRKGGRYANGERVH